MCFAFAKRPLSAFILLFACFIVWPVFCLNLDSSVLPLESVMYMRCMSPLPHMTLGLFLAADA